MARLLSEEEENKIAPLLPQIIDIKQKICDIVKNDCVKCPLNCEDVCTQLELKEFNFDEHEWIESEKEN